MKLHIVMCEPEIPQNTGNIARTCAATGSKLHLVYPLGFKITDKYLKRAGLDYWDKLEIEEHDSLNKFLGASSEASYSKYVLFNFSYPIIFKIILFGNAFMCSFYNLCHCILLIFIIAFYCVY